MLVEPFSFYEEKEGRERMRRKEERKRGKKEKKERREKVKRKRGEEGPETQRGPRKLVCSIKSPLKDASWQALQHKNSSKYSLGKIYRWQNSLFNKNIKIIES